MMKKRRRKLKVVGGRSLGSLGRKEEVMVGWLKGVVFSKIGIFFLLAHSIV